MDYKTVISVIVPVYNVEKYLPRCIDSVLVQDYSGFELLLVDDGSTDNSLSVCRKYESDDNRVKVITKKNGGASSARNDGINAATGKYLMFLDSDDFYESANLLTEINKKIEEKASDIILYGWKKFDAITEKFSPSGTPYDLSVFAKNDFAASVRSLTQSHLFPPAAWIFAVKAELIREYSIQFWTGIIAEDIDWTTKVFRVANSIDALNGVFYAYRKNQTDSVTANAGFKGINSVMTIIAHWQPILVSENKKTDADLLHNLAHYFFTIFVLYAKLSGENKRLAGERIRKNAGIIHFGLTGKLKIMKRMYQILGLELTSKLLSTAHQLKN